MPALIAGIHVLSFGKAKDKDVDGRDKPGHDAKVPPPENRAAIRKRDMNPGKNNPWDSRPGLSSCFARVSSSNSCSEVLEPAMYKMLVVALLTACAVNIACLCGHL